MANDCLVKRLKGVVDNDSLLKLGEMRIKCSTAACGGTTTEAMRTFCISVTGTVTAEGRTFKVKPSTGSSAYTEVTEYTADNLTECMYIFPDGEYNVHISNKYTIYGFGEHGTMTSSPFFSFDLKELAYTPILFYLNSTIHYGITGELKYINAATDVNHAIKLNDYFSPTTNKAFMNINLLADDMRLTELSVYGGSQAGENEQSYGSINNIKSPILVIILINRSKITGDANTMIQNMIAAGRTSGDIYMQGNNLVTVNGTPWEDFKNTLSGTTPTVKFTIDMSAPNHWTAVRSDS